MKKLREIVEHDATHFFKAGARLARTGGTDPKMAHSWNKENKLSKTQSRHVMRGFHSELKANPDPVVATNKGARLGGKK
jgi:hypothetical protein